MSRNPWLTFALFAGICFSVAAVGSVWTSRSVRTWYVRLQKPSFNPPSWVFGPVWSVLYLAWPPARGWCGEMQDGASREQLLFSFLSSWDSIWPGPALFFGLHRPGLAFVDILALLATIVATAIVFRSFSEAAFWLMVPYAVWVSFASLLNFEIWRLNSER